MRRPLLHAATFALLLALLPIALVVADFGATALRKLLISRGMPTHPKLRITSSIYHHDLAPLYSGEDEWGGARVPYFTNELGFRDVGPRAIDRNERGRVLVLGDSFAEGMGVPYPETVPGRLGPRTLNAAVSSYSPVIHYRKARHLLETVGLRVDSVLVFVDLSDAHDARFFRLNDRDVVEETIPLDRNTWGNLTARDSLSWLLANHTTVLGAWYEASFCRRHADDCRYSLWNERGKWPSDVRLWEEFGRDGLEKMSTHLDRLREVLDTRGIEMTIVIYPWPSQIFRGEKDDRHSEFWRQWTRERGVPLVDLYPDFIAAGPPRRTLERYFIPRDVHWNAAGHAFVAERLARFKSSRLLE
jgi:hypothetical protein